MILVSCPSLDITNCCCACAKELDAGPNNNRPLHARHLSASHTLYCINLVVLVCTHRPPINLSQRYVSESFLQMLHLRKHCWLNAFDRVHHRCICVTFRSSVVTIEQMRHTDKTLARETHYMPSVIKISLSPLPVCLISETMSSHSKPTVQCFSSQHFLKYAELFSPNTQIIRIFWMWF